MAKNIFTSFENGMKVNYSNIRFSGYSNIIATSMQGSNDTSIDFIAMKLDDNGEKDLTKFRQIKKIMDLPAEEIEKDVFTYINCIHNQIGEVGIFSKIMLNCGEGLLIAKEELSPKDYKDLEQFTLKAYTFVANLTKRIFKDESVHNTTPSDIEYVKDEAYNNVGRLFMKKTEACDFIKESSIEKQDVNEIAKIINKKISKSLKCIF